MSWSRRLAKSEPGSICTSSMEQSGCRKLMSSKAKLGLGGSSAPGSSGARCEYRSPMRPVSSLSMPWLSVVRVQGTA
eukprot:26071-Prymnesium_polylepis.1